MPTFTYRCTRGHVTTSPVPLRSKTCPYPMGKAPCGQKLTQQGKRR